MRARLELADGTVKWWRIKRVQPSLYLPPIERPRALEYFDPRDYVPAKLIELLFVGTALGIYRYEESGPGRARWRGYVPAGDLWPHDTAPAPMRQSLFRINLRVSALTPPAPSR